MNEVKPIRSEADYEAALAEVERLWGARSGTPEGDRLDVLATLIDAYESEHHPIDPPDPIEAIKFRMEQQSLTRKDLEGILGSRARIAEVLNRHRGLSISMIRRLHDKLGISTDVLILPSYSQRPDDYAHPQGPRERDMAKINDSDFNKISKFMTARWPQHMHEIYQPAMLKVLIKKEHACVSEIAESIRSDDITNTAKNYQKIVKQVVGKVLTRHGLVMTEGEDFRLVPNQLTDDERDQLISRCDEEIRDYLAKKYKDH